MIKNDTISNFHNPDRVSNNFGGIPPATIFTLLTICIYLSSWILMLSVFRFTFCNTLSTQLQYSFDYSVAFLTTSQILGMLSNWLIVKEDRYLTKSIVVISVLCLIGSSLLFILKQQYIFYMLLALFFLFGQYVASATLLFHKYIPRVKRFHSIGLVLISNSIASFVIHVFSVNISLTGLFALCFFATLVVTIFSILLYRSPLAEPNIHIINLKKAELNKIYYHLLIYVSCVSYIKGFLFHSIPKLFSQYSVIALATVSLGYILSVMFFMKLAKKQQISVSNYVANSVFLLSFVCLISFSKLDWLSVFFAAIIYSTFGMNDLFCFETLFALGERFPDSSNFFGVGFSMYIFSVFLGEITATYVDIIRFPQFELLIIVIYSVATLVLPQLKGEMAKLLPESVFSVDSISLKSEDTSTDASCNALPMIQEISPAPNNPANAMNELLSQRENEVLQLLLKGYPNDLIASTLYISNNTLKKHIQNIYNKLGVHSRSELFLLLKMKE